MSLEKQQLIEENFLRIFKEDAMQKRLPEKDFELFIKSRQNLSFAKHDILFEDGQNPSGVYFIVKGTAKLSKMGAYGKEQILRFIKENDLVGYRSLLCSENFQARAEAMTDMEVVFLPADLFMHLLNIDPQFSFAMLQKIAYELGESSNTITFLAQKTVRERLAEVLILLEQKLGTDEEGFVNISLTREEIANLIGTATESAIRLISEFRNDGLIESEGRSIKILNHEKLMKLGHVVI